MLFCSFLSIFFHSFLFRLYQGVKLNSQSKIIGHTIGSGQFLVLVPFTKKVRQSNQSATTSEVPNQGPVSDFADSAWFDMMQDLRTLSNLPNNENQTNFDSTNVLEGVRNESVEETSAAYPLGRKRKKFLRDQQEGSLDDLIFSILKSPCKIFLDKQNCERLVRVLESVNCLLDTQSGCCKLLREVGLVHGDAVPSGSNSRSCLCPAWLKIIMKTFTFLNIYSSFLQLQRGHITLIHLNEVLGHLGELGFQVGVEDIEHFSVLCPKVINCIFENFVFSK